MESNYYQIHFLELSKDKTTVLGLKFYPQNVTIPEGVICIKDGVFSRTCLEDISLPDSLKYLGASAFYGCSCLKNIIIPHGVKKIEYRTFFECSSLTNVILSNSIHFIDKGIKGTIGMFCKSYYCIVSAGYCYCFEQVLKRHSFIFF